MMKLIRNLIILLVVGTTSISWADRHIPWELQERHWYGVTIDGARAGWSEETVWTRDNLLKTQKILEMSLSRTGMTISIKVSTEFVETVDGEPVRVHSTQEAMGQSQETSWKFNESTIEMTSVAGGEPIVKTLPRPEGPWMTPQAITRMFVNKLREGATEITYRTMAPEYGAKPVTVVMTKKGDEERVILGEKTSVTKWETVNDVMPIIGMEWYTHEGLNVASSINAGFGAISNTMMEKHEALAPVIEVPELMVSLLVEPDKAIPNDPELKQLTMRIKSKDGRAVTLPTSGAQRATNNDDGTVTLEISLDRPVAATKEELETCAYILSSAMCDGNDEVVASIAKDVMDALPEDASDMEKALALRAKVFAFIDNKGLSSAFASASQTARDRKGDCSEHAVLLCGVLRSSDIKSRGVMGMVYVPNYGAPNGVFGWHMWSQALIDGHWIDLDATLRTPYSVGHIATTTTSLSDEGLAAEMGGILTIIGNLDVEVVHVGAPAQ